MFHNGFSSFFLLYTAVYSGSSGKQYHEEGNEVGKMKESSKMMINEALIMWAFGSAVDHYDAAAALISVTALAFMMYTYDTAKMKTFMVRGLIAADLCLLAAHVSGLSAVIPSAGFPIAVNAIFAVMTALNSWRLMDRAVRWISGALLAYLALSLVIPGSQFSFVQLLTLVLLIFGPVLLVYCVRVLCDAPHCKYRGSAFGNEIK
jgi:hypothetical protein